MIKNLYEQFLKISNLDRRASSLLIDVHSDEQTASVEHISSKFRNPPGSFDKFTLHLPWSCFVQSNKICLTRTLSEFPQPAPFRAYHACAVLIMAWHGRYPKEQAGRENSVNLEE